MGVDVLERGSDHISSVPVFVDLERDDLEGVGPAASPLEVSKVEMFTAMGEGFAKQLALPLTVREPYDLDYFVPHSGVAACVEEIKLSLFSVVQPSAQETKQFANDSEQIAPAFFFYISGPHGSGKSHLAKGVCLAARGLGIFITEPLCIDDGIFSDGVLLDSDDGAARFISATEEIRRKGGVCIVTSLSDAASSYVNPHVLSRLKGSAQFSLSLPREEELKPVLISIFERRNLRVSQKTLEFLLRRLPADPLSFVDVVGRIDEFSLASGRSARGNAVREIVAEYKE